MAVSANTLFHFTKIGALEKIIASLGFYCQYSDEYFEGILPETNPLWSAYIPMISFCDLTISQLANDSVHTENFGKYGIGLTKEWGIKNRVSPVMYVHSKSRPTSQLSDLIELFKSFSETSDEYVTISQVREELIDSLKYIKPYKGRWHKGEKILQIEDDIIYYNEREWRYSPLINDYEILPEINRSKKLKEKFNKKLKKSLIKFSPEDIKFIIVKEKSEITAFVKIINKLDIDGSQKNHLITKILTFEEIEEDYV